MILWAVAFTAIGQAHQSAGNKWETEIKKFEKRIMWGSDQMVWPRTIEVAIKTIEAAPFLSTAQKRDIFYNKAARFLRLSKEEIAKHHGR